MHTAFGSKSVTGDWGVVGRILLSIGREGVESVFSGSG
jgi:hypothetical protein